MLRAIVRYAPGYYLPDCSLNQFISYLVFKPGLNVETIQPLNSQPIYPAKKASGRNIRNG